MVQATRMYKTVFQKNPNKYEKKRRKEIKNMRTRIPKCYLAYVNSLNKRSKQEDLDMIVINDFLTFKSSD